RNVTGVQTCALPICPSVTVLSYQTPQGLANGPEAAHLMWHVSDGNLARESRRRYRVIQVSRFANPELKLNCNQRPPFVQVFGPHGTYSSKATIGFAVH